VEFRGYAVTVQPHTINGYNARMIIDACWRVNSYCRGRLNCQRRAADSGGNGQSVDSRTARTGCRLLNYLPGRDAGTLKVIASLDRARQAFR
jgi:hypothetical protein